MSSSSDKSQAARCNARGPHTETKPDTDSSNAVTIEQTEWHPQKEPVLYTAHTIASHQEVRRSSSPAETEDVLPTKTLSSEEAEADYQKQLALLHQQNIDFGKNPYAAGGPLSKI